MSRIFRYPAIAVDAKTFMRKIQDGKGMCVNI